MHWIERRMQCASLMILALGVVVASGCSTTNAASPLPNEGLSMLEVYRGAVGPTENTKRADRKTSQAHALCAELVGARSRRQCRRKAVQLGLLQASESAPLFKPLSATQSRTALESKMPAAIDTGSITGSPAASSESLAPTSVYEPYTRTAQTEIAVLFPRLPNPDITIYIYPHLATRNQVPVPGYATVIPLYESVHYALPGELPSETTDAQRE